MNPLSFESVALLSPLWLLPAVCCLLLSLRHPPAGYGGWRRVMAPGVLHFLGGTGNGSSGRWPLLFAAWIALALSAPAVRISDANTWRHSTAWIAIVDVSRSMTHNDVTPSRLAAARDTVIALSDAAGARPLALMIYAGDAFLVSPPAFDRSLLETHASLLAHGSVPVEGSNIARALSLASSIVTDSGLVSARLFLLGDSAGATRNAHKAARFLSDAGHRLDVVQFGRVDNTIGSSGAVDLKGVTLLAREGGGKLLIADVFGAVNLASLDLEDSQSDIEGLRSVYWRNLSHWMLIPAALMFIWLMCRRKT